MTPHPRLGFGHNAARVARLAWPVFIGQISVLAFATLDTVIVGRSSPIDLAALSVGSAAYITVFIGLMGIVVALGPLAGQMYGANRLPEAGKLVHQAVWIALGLAALGVLLLAFPEPFLKLSKVAPDVEARVRGYLRALAFAVPASLLFSVYRAFNTAVARPKAVMALQVGGLLMKVPLSLGLALGVPALGLPPLGVVGCGIATALVMWTQVLAAVWWMRRDAFYAPFAIFGRGLDRPQRAAIADQLRLGLPMGGSVLIEVTAFAFMGLFIARLGTTPVAAHQIALNLASLAFMMPMAIGNATSALVAQRIGAEDLRDAERLGWHGLALGCGVALAMALGIGLGREGIVGLYTQHAEVAAVAVPLVLWAAWFHLADAVQCIVAFTLRAWRVATLPMVIYALALWVIGLGGAGWMVFGHPPTWVPAAWRGAEGYWVTACAGLYVAALMLTLLQWRTARARRMKPSAVAAAVA